MHCGAEKANLCQWLQEESYKAYEVFYGAQGVDVDVAFFALLHLHELHRLEGNWRAKTESVGAPPDTTEWVGSICPPLLEDFASSSAECPSTEVLWSRIGKRMQSLYFVNWIVMTMDWNMIEALSLTPW